MLPHEVPTLPVLVPMTTVVVAAVLWWLHRSGRLTAARAAVWVALVVYGAGVLGHVLLPFPIDAHDPRPWHVWLHLTPLVDVAEDPIGIILNVALFVPLGLLLPVATRVGSARLVVLHGLLISLGIETLQLLASVTVSPGRIADVDDLVGNTLGTFVGYLVLRQLMRVPAAARLARRAAWTPTAEAAPSTATADA